MGKPGTPGQSGINQKKKSVQTLELTELQLKGETRDGINKKNTLGLSELKLKGETRDGINKKNSLELTELNFKGEQETN